MTPRPLYFVQTDRSTNGEPYTGNLYGTDYVEGAHGPYLTAKTAKWMSRKVRRGEVQEWVAVRKDEYDALVGGEVAVAESGDCAEACVPVDAYNAKVLELNGLRSRLAELEAAVAEIDADPALDASADGGDGASEPGADDVEVSPPLADASAVSPSDATWTSLQKAVFAVKDEWSSLGFDSDDSPKRPQAEAIVAAALKAGLEMPALEAKA